MRRLVGLILIFILGVQLAIGSADNCRNILNWIYRDLTLNNLDKSYDRLMNKFLIGLLHVQNTSKDQFDYNPEMTRVYNTLKAIDEDFNKTLEPNRTSWITNIFLQSPNLTPTTLNSVFEAWRDLQRTSPDLFTGLDQKFMLDDWDKVTVDTLSEVSQFKFENSQYKKRLEILAKNLSNEQTNVLNGKNIDLSALESQIDLTEKELFSALGEGYRQTMNEYGEICTTKDLSLLVNNNQYACPTREPAQDKLSLELANLGSLIDESELMMMVKPTLKIGEKTDVELTEYERNDNPKTSFCLRSPELVSMIVIHHTETSEDTSPQRLNQFHLDRSTQGDPWYMLGYNYLVSENYKEGEISVIQGRPPNIKGAHAGGYTAKLTPEQVENYKNKTVMCGNRKNGFKETPVLSQTNSAGGISGNLVSLGIAVVCNYAPLKWEIIDGVNTPENIYAESTEEVEVPDNIVRKVATLACDLQKQNKNIKTIVPHQYFKATKCPGSIIKRLNQIKDLAKNQGCQFEVVLSKGEQNE